MKWFWRIVAVIVLVGVWGILELIGFLAVSYGFPLVETDAPHALNGLLFLYVVLLIFFACIMLPALIIESLSKVIEREANHFWDRNK